MIYATNQIAIKNNVISDKKHLRCDKVRKSYVSKITNEVISVYYKVC